MRGVEVGAMVLCVVGIVACGDRAESGSTQWAIASPARSISGAEHRVTGSATVILPNFGNALEHYSVSAIQHGDGTVTGEFEEFSEQEGGQRIHAEIYCLSVSGNSARLAARIDQTNVSFGPTSSYVIWSVVDNGEGARSAPDQTTDIFFGATPAIADFHCRTGINLAPYFSSLRGNLQVQ